MTDAREPLRGLLAKIASLEADAQTILATHEAASARVITLEQSYSQLSG